MNFNVDILETSLRILEKYCLCDHCLGRQFALLARGTDNSTRGFSIKLLLAMIASKLIKENCEERGVYILRILAENGKFSLASEILSRMGVEISKGKPCYICNDILLNLDTYADRIVSLISQYEFSSFLVGSRIPGEIAEREDSLRSEFGLTYGESFKSEFNRELGKLLQSRIGREVDFSSPDLVVIVDFLSDNIEVHPSPLFIYGRYRKLVRGIPQCTWICSSCRGVGCEQCNYTGRKYPTSIEELIAIPVLKFTLGKDVVFHGAGREDVDARMLGTGRPFIVEVKEPKKRFIDLKKLEEEINRWADGKIEVSDLRFSSRSEVKRLKVLSSITQKTYRVLVRFEGEVTEDDLRRVEEFFVGREVRQRTPLRVIKRRADKVRVKTVYFIKAKIVSSNLAEMTIKCQGGLYIKELVSGDNGRTFPSIAEVVGVPAECVELDVIDVSDVV
ncbi:MAG: tRNA pseudouridine(54/55) synthase Pus10 [archaeon GB-1867-035]|nr:tRNA pseudouridine(54/55) synthase Pus10 [Candidatus Culexmicrobium profundum]